VRRPQGALNPGVVEDRDGAATLLEIQEGGRAIPFLACQVAASRS
jgi:hypothetical protein